jgi:hypothetical protein
LDFCTKTRHQGNSTEKALVHVSCIQNIQIRGETTAKVFGKVDTFWTYQYPTKIWVGHGNPCADLTWLFHATTKITMRNGVKTPFLGCPMAKWFEAKRLSSACFHDIIEKEMECQHDPCE